MFGAIEPLGDLVTTLPAGQEYPGRTAGPSFELFYESDYVLPHREAAWVLLVERLHQAADFCEPGAPCGPAVGDGLRQVRASLTEIADALAVHLPARYAPQPPAGDPAPLLARASDYSRTGQAFAPGDDPALSGVAALLASAYQAALDSDPRTLARLVDSVLRPLAETLPAPALPPPHPEPSRTPGTPAVTLGSRRHCHHPARPPRRRAPRPACSRRPRRCRTSRSVRPPRATGPA